ncbi:hypothetical protein GCM10027052_29330 [Parafrigoribacterium mesophilum]|uniref:PadR family transcriptional regulator n=1 Tax=Parafrigoribacterium mesophilum TaxID=433646 RepID=UPI003D158873
MSALTGFPHRRCEFTDAAALTDGGMKLQAGTLYAALDRLRTAGLVEVSSEDVVQGRLRRSFALTQKGKTSLAAEAERRRSGAVAALRRLGVSTPRARGVEA